MHKGMPSWPFRKTLHICFMGEKQSRKYQLPLHKNPLVFDDGKLPKLTWSSLFVQLRVLKCWPPIRRRIAMLTGYVYFSLALLAKYIDTAYEHKLNNHTLWYTARLEYWPSFCFGRNTKGGQYIALLYQHLLFPIQSTAKNRCLQKSED